MSQGRNVYEAAPGLGVDWMVLYATGARLRHFTMAATWTSLVEQGRCGADDAISQILFIFDPAGSSNMLGDLALASGFMRDRYPNAEQDWSLLVGARGHAACLVGTQTVRASTTHRDRIGLMTMPEAGPDLDINCSGYQDALGHLNATGAADAQSQVSAFYGPPPSTTTTVSPTTTTA